MILIKPSLITTLFTCAALSSSMADTDNAANIRLSGNWKICRQSFASHDEKSTDTETIEGKQGDFIFFDQEGRANCFFNNKADTLEYKLVGKDSISFGDTPFSIRRLPGNRVELYQNEEENNGDYNRMWIILEKF